MEEEHLHQQTEEEQIQPMEEELHQQTEEELLHQPIEEEQILLMEEEEIQPIEEEDQIHVIVMLLPFKFVVMGQQMLLLHVETIKEMHVKEDVHLQKEILLHVLQLLQHVIVKDKQEQNVVLHQHPKQLHVEIMNSMHVQEDAEDLHLHLLNL
jgi:hypothetical protein